MSIFGPSLNPERAKSGSDMCALSRGKPCSRRGVVTIVWNDYYTKVKACRQHAKSSRRPVVSEGEST